MPNVRIPDDTQSIHNIGEYILSYQPYQNAFLNALVNRIGRVLVTSKLWENPWRVFKKGKLEYGETVEEIFANIAKPHQFDPEIASKEVFKREIPDVRAAFHSMNFQKFYKVTITNEQLRQAFLSYGELTNLVSKIVETLYTSMNLDEYLVMKYMVCREALNGGIYSVVVGDNLDQIKKFREYTNNLTFLKTAYNRASVRNSTPVSEQVIVIPNDVEAELGVDVLANAFNISQVDYISQRIALDSMIFETEDTERLAMLFENDNKYVPFTDDEITKLKSIKGFKFDKDWFMVFDNFEQFTENYNGQGLYWQYFYHVWKTFSASPFANAVMFTNETSSITSVTVTPAEQLLAEEDLPITVKYSAKVAGTGMFDSSVTWTMKERNGKDSELGATNINPLNGELFISVPKADDYSFVIDVTATAKDGTTGTATVSVSKKASD